MNNLIKEKYSFLKHKSYSHKKYTIIPLRNEDIFHIKKWRNEQINILRQAKIITDAQQKIFFQNLTQNSFYVEKPQEILFSFLYDDVCIGYGGLVYIDWDEGLAEISFINETKRAIDNTLYYDDFTNFISLLFEISFSELKFNKLTTETYGIRKNTLKILPELGFKLKNVKEDCILIGDKKYDSFFHEYCT